MPSSHKRLSDTINIGVADIYFYPEASDIGVYLGLTIDGVTFKYETDWHTLTSDQTGKTPLDDVMIGEQVSAEVKVLDTSKSKIAIIVPAATALGASDNPEAVTFGRRPGLRVTHHSGKLVIHPVSMGNDFSNDVIIYRTANSGSLELAFKLEEEWVIPCMFKGYFDDFRKEGDQVFRIGAGSGEVDDEIYRRVILFWITPSNPKVEVDDTVPFRANAMFEDGSTEDVTAQCSWYTSDDGIVELSGSSVRMATARQAGSVVIRADYIGYSNSTSMVVI